ncbi:hypothetical protein TCAL_13998 [Tigriopus californicus]|uniref:Uncharacterized protein n=1 Tax=Tigriopus californicus TaxID=6832 RepID=A0A553N978_TIGCA|nr:MYG1 exonuclease-like [Tigriopus californicus]TRY62004.1 hypothetical protein TCAL_13998 [Tigriopus californicus]
MLKNLVSKMVKIGTHNGTFHCDEVLACAMLKLLPAFQDAEIVRSRDPKVLAECDIVVDVGGEFNVDTQRFDHHQKSFNETVSSLMEGKKWVTKLSSAGLVYVHYGKPIIKHVLDVQDDQLVDKVFDKVYANFMEEIDAQDNGIPTHDGEARYQISTHLGARVANLRPKWNDDTQDFNAGFHRALDLVRPEFLDKVRYFAQVWWPARGIVATALEERFSLHKSGRIIFFQNGRCPYKEHLFDLEEEQGIAGHILYAVFADSNGSWRVSAVPVKDQAFESRLKLPAAWLALRDEELSGTSGIPGCVFVHANGFIGGNATKQGALAMAIKSVEMSSHV